MSIDTFALRATLMATSLSCAGLVHAAVDVYTQAPNGTSADVSAVWNDSADPGFTWTLDQDEQAWAYFSLAAPVRFNRITWYGSNTDGNFAVDVFAASCFSCGVSLVTTSGSFANNLISGPSAFAPAQVQKALLASGQYAYSVNLPSLVTLNATSPGYAISVVNNYTAMPFVWGGSSTGSGTHLHFVVGQAMFLPSPGNLAFTLTDTTASAVPEPSRSLLLVAGLAGCAGLLRRRA